MSYPPPPPAQQPPQPFHPWPVHAHAPPPQQGPGAPPTSWSSGRVMGLVGSPGFLIALLAFFLPWYAISCAGQPLAEATGMQTATSGFQSSKDNPLSRMGGGLGGGGGGGLLDEDDESPPKGRLGAPPAPSLAKKPPKEFEEASPWIFVYPALCVLGFALALGSGLSRTKAGRALGFAAAGVGVGALAVQVVQLFVMKSRLADAMTAAKSASKGVASGLGGSGDPLGKALSGGMPDIPISIDVRAGWMLALIGVLLAVILVGIGALIRAPAEKPPGWA